MLCTIFIVQIVSWAYSCCMNMPSFILTGRRKNTEHGTSRNVPGFIDAHPNAQGKNCS